jgi:hypothetical protein
MMKWYMYIIKHKDAILVGLVISLVLTFALEPYVSIFYLDSQNWKFFLLLKIPVNIITIIFSILQTIVTIHFREKSWIKIASLVSIGIPFMLLYWGHTSIQTFKDINVGAQEYIGQCELRSHTGRYFITSYYLKLTEDKDSRELTVDYPTFETFDGKYNDATQKYQCNQKVNVKYLENSKLMLEVSKGN